MTDRDLEGIIKYSLRSLILMLSLGNASTKLECSQVCRKCSTQRTQTKN